MKPVTSERDIADRIAMSRGESSYAHGVDGGVIAALARERDRLADDLKAARDEVSKLRDELADNYPDAAVDNALKAQRSTMRTLVEENAAMAALLGDFDKAIDCDVIQFGRDGECALASEGGCWQHRRLDILEARAKRMGETGGGK